MRVGRWCTDISEFLYKALGYSSDDGQTFCTVSQNNSLVYFVLLVLLKDLP